LNLADWEMTQIILIGMPLQDSLPGGDTSVWMISTRSLRRGGRDLTLDIVKTAAVEKGPLTSKPQDIARPSSYLCYKKSVLLIVLDIISDNYSMPDIKQHIRI